MSEFGRLLRFYRRNSRDPERGGPLTQERLGEFIGRQLGDLGYTGAAISHWERGHSSINQNEREVLLALVKCLHEFGGLAKLQEANQFLAAGNYRQLDETELVAVDPGWPGQVEAWPVVASPVRPGRQWERLRTYLPEPLYREVELAPREDREGLCLEHLRGLLRSIATYVPWHIALALLQAPEEAASRKPGEFQDGTLLFADISGFTDLSERLREMGGKEGAEEVVRIINQYLDVMLGILFKHDGRLIKFGGDAMLCLFRGEKQGAMNAIWTAWEMRREMTERFAEIEAFQEVFPLSMKVGNSSGLLFATTAGDETHLEYILTGSAVERTAQAESAASRGEVVVSSDTYAQIKDQLEVEPLPDREGYYRVIDVPPDPAAEAADPWSEIEGLMTRPAMGLWEILDSLDALAPYLPVGILTQLVYDPSEGHMQGQHRQVTVLFANFVGMSEVINAYGVDDPASIDAVITEYFQAMQEEVHYYGGITNKVDLYDQGDKLMVIFGAPQAHERDARRAALTALAMQEAMERLSQPVAAALLSQRIGIHSGFVFAGNVGSATHHRREYTVMGDTVNTAARLMSKADRGQVWISQEVMSQLEDAFQARPLPPLKLKGIPEPVTAYHLQGVREALRLGRPARDLSSEMVGREGELKLLGRLFDEMLFGEEKRIVAITGEGGVGKSRLVNEWREQTERMMGRERPVTWLVGYGRAYGRRSNGVFKDVLEQLCGIGPEDEPSERWNKLARHLRTRLDDTQKDWVRLYTDQLAYLGHFLGLDLALREGLQERVDAIEPETLQLQTRLALADLLSEVAGAGPCVLLLEDLHWADADSLELLQFLVDRVADDVPLMFCLVYRSQKERRIWSLWQEIARDFPGCELVQLGELEPAAGGRLLRNLLRTEQSLDPAFEDLVQEETDGNPLYMEEVLHALIEDGMLVQQNGSWRLARPVERLGVPNSLYQIIQSRIDELDFASPGARRVLWLAATLGMSFTEDALWHLFAGSGRDRSEFQRHMRELRNAAMLERARVQAGDGERAGFKFRHGLLQQVAYENMPVSNRRRYHREVADWLEMTYEGTLAAHYDALAYHYDQAQAWPEAFHYHRLVGERDARAYASESAVAHLRRALEIAEAIEPDPFAAGHVHLALGRALEVVGDVEGAIEQLTLAYQRLGESPLEEARPARARSCYHLGRVYQRSGGQENLEQALAWRERGEVLLPERPTAEAALLHVLAGIVRVRQRAWKEAAQEGVEALRLAQAAGADGVLAHAFRLLSVAARAQGDLPAALEHSRAAAAADREHADLIGLARDGMNQGVIAFEMDEWEAARDAYLESYYTYERIGGKHQIAMICANLGDLYYHLGHVEEGVSFAQQALAAARELDATDLTILALTVIATHLWRKGEWDQAREHLLEAKVLMEEREAAEFAPSVGAWLAQVALSAGDAATAEAELASLLDDSAELGVEWGMVQRLWGLSLAAGGDVEAAGRVLRETITALEGRGERYQAACARLALAGVLAAREDGAAEARELAADAGEVFAALGAALDAAAAERLAAGS